MKILILGSGGREAALAWKIAKSDLVSSVVVSPGNPGMTRLSPKIQLSMDSDRNSYLSHFPDLVVVGPEALLAEGIADFFEEHSVPVVGPSGRAALLESSKDFCKEILTLAGVPTAKYKTVTDLEAGLKSIAEWPLEEMVIKVDALASGKGVVVAKDHATAARALTEFMNGNYLGQKVPKILIEEVLYGDEVSAFALCDGNDFVYLGSATDYKRLLDGDEGPNTGGMGTISPAPVLTHEDEHWIKNQVFAPTLKAMKDKGIPFKGVLFAGLMKTKSGLSVLEFNVRLGDPETQSLLPRIEEDLVPILLAAAKGELKKITFKGPSFDLSSLHIVMTAKGYPGVQGEAIRKGDKLIIGQLAEGAIFFPAGVGEQEEQLISNGGRICGVTAVGKGLSWVRALAYKEIKNVHFEGAHYRKDIGERFL